jgi:hypothetical protein
VIPVDDEALDHVVVLSDVVEEIDKADPDLELFDDLFVDDSVGRKNALSLDISELVFGFNQISSVTLLLFIGLLLRVQPV